MVARQWGAQEVAELARKSQVMEGAMRDVTTTGEGAAASSGFLQARGHSEMVEMIESQGVPLFVTQRVSCCSPV